MTNNYSKTPGFRSVPRTGVIYVMHEAIKHGYFPEKKEWANLGQGAPETGALEESPERRQSVEILINHHEYSPVVGLTDLRKKVAEFYNYFYRKGKSSQYTYENVCISGGGRAGLTRLAASLSNINMGHFIPDYTAYEELLNIFKAFVSIPILLSPKKHYSFSTKELTKEITGRGLKALLISNPCNPTGKLISDEELNQWVSISRKLECTFIMDEFYSHYIYSDNNKEQPKMVSAAEFVDDVNLDPVIIVDGLTKNWRYPGWRISWTVAPVDVIERISSAGSFLDGGANHPFQKETISLLDPKNTIAETSAIQNMFGKKRSYMLNRLAEMNIKVELEPQGSFYVWVNLSNLPVPINDGMALFKEGLKEKVITVPGNFFDVNPGKRRSYARFQQYSRISFGPSMAEIKQGLDSLERTIQQFKS